MNGPPALTKQVGPMPLWGWFIVGGGVLILVFFHKTPAVAAVTNPQTAFPPPPTQPPMLIPGGSGVYDPTTGSAMPATSLADLLGGSSMSAFLNSLGPNFAQFGLQVGGATMNVTNSPQNVLDAEAHAEEMAYQTVMNAPHVLDPNQVLVNNSGDIFTGFAMNTGPGTQTFVANPMGMGPDQITQNRRIRALNAGLDPDNIPPGWVG